MTRHSESKCIERYPVGLVIDNSHGNKSLRYTAHHLYVTHCLESLPNILAGRLLILSLKAICPLKNDTNSNLIQAFACIALM